MARVQKTRTWQLSGVRGDVDALVADFARDRGMDVDPEPDGLEAEGGSQAKMKVLGGWFVGGEELPHRVRVHHEGGPDSMTLTARVEESSTTGFMDPLTRRRYEVAFKEWLDDLGSALARVADVERAR
jgi:hypothetical protein